MNTNEINPDTAVLNGELPAVHCQYCERPFDAERSCAFHVGEAHADRWTESERIAYEEAREAEEEDLWIYHMKIVVGLGVMYAVVVLLYMIILG
jgi:hypothetical protein